MKFACDNGKSSGEKYRRASLLNEAVIFHMKDDDKFVQTFLSSKFVGDEGMVTQFEAITAGPDLDIKKALKENFLGKELY